MNYSLIFLFLLINYGKNAFGTNSNEVDLKDPTNDSSKVDDKWVLYELETNPYIDLRHPNFNGSFIRSIDEYYVFETKEYNKYKKERYYNLLNNIEFEKKQFNCVINLLIHGRPNSREFNDYKIWSSQANIIKEEAMAKKKYSKYILYSPFISLSNFLGNNGVHSHVDFSYIVALRLAMTFKNIASDETCYNYDVFVHSHCFGANIMRIILSLNNDLWKIRDLSHINLKFERDILAILEENFKMTLKNIDIITDKSHIKINKEPYFKGPRYYLYKSFRANLQNKKLTNTLDEMFNDEEINYNELNEDLLKVTNINYTKSIDKENQLNRVVKRLHYYLLNKKINLLNISATGPPLSGLIWKVEDVLVGHQKKIKFKSLIRFIPSFIKHRIIKIRDVEELMLVKNPKLFCLLAVEEKVTYDYNKNRGSLITYFKHVNYYADMDNDELVSMYTSLGLHSSIHMRSLSFFMLNFRNEYYNRIFKIPVHLSDINVSDNGSFFDYLEKTDVCTYVKEKDLESFISFVNELVNYNQKPKPFIPQRHTYKSPFLVHFKVPMNQGNNIYTPHSLLGTGRTYLLLYSYEIYKHLSEDGLSDSDVMKNDAELFYDTDPFIYYNWMVYVSNQRHRNKKNLMNEMHMYTNDINMNIVDNLFNIFISSHYLKFIIFCKRTKQDGHRKLYRTIERYSLPKFNIILNKQEKKLIKIPLFISNELNEKEKRLYEYFSIYTNFLKNFSYNNAITYIPKNAYFVKHKEFKEYQNENINNLKEQLRKIQDFVEENRTFVQMKKQLKRMYDIESADDVDSDDNTKNEQVYDVFENYMNSDIIRTDDNESINNNNEGKEYIDYRGIYAHVKRSLSLKYVFENIASSRNFKDIHYVEFLIKSAKHENVEDNLNDLENTSYCLFNLNDEFDLSYIVNFCNYNQHIYSNIRKHYVSNPIYVIDNISNCSLEKYKHLKICENSILIKKFFRSNLETVLSDIHYKEYKKMSEMKNAIERSIRKKDILSLSNDSLVAIFHNKNEGFVNFNINVCFKVSDTSTNKNLFSRDDKTEPKIDYQKNSHLKKNNSVFCTHVNLPVKLNDLLIKSLNDIYMRAFRNIVQNKQFQEIFNITENEESYKSFVYFFDKFSYIYNLKNMYKHTNDLNVFSTPQNMKWNKFYYLLKYEANTDFNNELFLHNFFYGKDEDLVEFNKENILKNFLKHFTAFFYIFKVN